MLMTPVIYAEDDENDAYFMELAFKNAGIPNPLIILVNGQQVIDYLDGTGKYADRKKYSLPSLLLLDLKMPLVAGLEVLEWMSRHPEHKPIKVIVVSSSGQALDIDLAKKLGALDYIIKPSRATQLTEIAQRLKSAWLS